MNCSPVESFRKNVKMAKSSGGPVHPQRKREGQNISMIVSNLARVFQSLPAPPKQYIVFDVFLRFSKFFSNLKTWGRTWQCAPTTDFYRKVNKFFQKFAKCDPCLI